MAETHNVIELKDLKAEILGNILSQVGKHSRNSLHNAMAASPVLARAARDERVYRTLNLRPLAMHPLAARRKYQDLMEKTLTHGNVEAHFIKGILEYFHSNRTITGLQHLKKAADGSYEDGVYLYGIVMMCKGQMEEGRAYLDKLGWEQNKAIADRCWKNIKNSFHGVRVMRLPIYMETIRAMRPTIMCDVNDLHNRCAHCYYYKQMVKFVFVI